MLKFFDHHALFLFTPEFYLTWNIPQRKICNILIIVSSIKGLKIAAVAGEMHFTHVRLRIVPEFLGSDSSFTFE
jgi:hypothetical protein